MALDHRGFDGGTTLFGMPTKIPYGMNRRAGRGKIPISRARNSDKFAFFERHQKAHNAAGQIPCFFFFFFRKRNSILPVSKYPPQKKKRAYPPGLIDLRRESPARKNHFT